jgi:hypothetical protein
MNIRTAERALDGIRDTNMAKLRTNLLRWMRVSIDNPSAPDGYPTSTIGAEASTAPSAGRRPSKCTTCGLDADDPAAKACSNSVHLGEATLNAVERAATAKKRRDVIDMNTTVAAQWIVQAEDLLRRAEHKLLENERYQDDKDLNPPGECWVMRQRADVFEAKAHKSDLWGLLDEPRNVSAWVYKFADKNRVLPTREQCRAHARGERVMIAA